MAATEVAGANRLKPARSRKWIIRTAALALAAGVAVWFAPALIARSPLLGRALRIGLADMRGTIDVSDASLGWFSPVELHGITVRDADGTTVAEIGTARSDKNLAALLWDSSDVGTWQVEQAVLHLTWNGKSSNIETVFHEYFYGPSNPRDFGAAYRVHVSGKAHVRDADANRHWTVDPVEVAVSAARERATPMSIIAKGPIVEPRDHGTLMLDIGIARTTPATPFAVTVKVEADRGPLAATNALLRRFQEGVNLDGSVSGHVEVKYVERQKDEVEISGQCEALQFGLEAPQWFAEPLRLKQVRVPMQLKLDGERLTVTALALQTDVGSGSAAGVFDLSGGSATLFQHAGAAIQCDIDLARLVKVLPKTLRFRDDVQLIAGRVQANVASTGKDGDVKWDGRIVTSDLEGMRNGQPVLWKQPLTFTIAARSAANDLPRVDRIHCSSDFLQLDATSPDDKQFVFSATGDLTKLRQNLARFVDVEGWMPDGQATATCTTTRTGAESFKVEGEAKIKQFQLRSALRRQFNEPEVVLKFAALVEPGKNGIREAKAGAVTLQAGPAWIWASLHEPLPLSVTGVKAHAKLRVYGDLTKWTSIIGTFVPEVADWGLSGMGEISGRIRYDAAEMEFHDLKAEYRDFRLRKFGANVVEPKVTMQVTGRRDAKTGRIQLLDSRFDSSTVTLSVPVATLLFDAKGTPEITGKGSFRGDLARLERWFRDAKSQNAFSGTLTGDVQVSPAGGVTNFKMDAAATLTQSALRAAAPASDQRVTAAVAGSFDGDGVRLETASIRGAGLSVQAAGAVRNLSKQPLVTINGRIDYDWDKVDPQLKSLLGANTRIAGRGSRPIRLEGTLASPLALSGELGIGWDSLQLFGCQAGAVALDMKFNNSSIQFTPIQTTLNQGRAYASPVVRLDPEPAELYFAKPSGVDRARITPAMCDELLGFAAPALARATDAEGEVTVRVTSGRVPLQQPEKADVTGQITLHSVRISATSPMLRLLSTFLQTPPTVALQKEALVNVRVVNGRVYHDKLELVFPGLTLKTSGSVGFDGSLEILVESPMPPRWLPNVPWKDALAKQTIKIPLRGTLSKPQLDEDAVRRHLAEITRDAARGAANDALRREVEKGFEKLFPPKK